MKKPATLIFLIISVGFLFAGAVTAENATVDLSVTNDMGYPITIAQNGQEVVINTVIVANEGTISNPYVAFNIDPDNGLQLETEQAIMWDDAQQKWTSVNISNDNTIHPGSWIWQIETSTGNDLKTGDIIELLLPAIVKTSGDITVNADLYSGIGDPNDIIVNSESYPFMVALGSTESNSTPSDSSTINTNTIPMQNTGAPLTVAILGILSIVGGTIYSRLK